MSARQFLFHKAKSPWVLLLVALLIAAAISLMTFKYLESRELRIKQEAAAQASGKRTPEVSVVVPVADAGIGTIVNSKSFAARSIPVDLLYDDTIKAGDFEYFTGQNLAKPLKQGRPLRVSDLIAPEVRDVSAVVPRGKRAFTIAIDNLNSIAQTVRPGNLLDIFLINRAPNGGTDLPEEARDQATLFMQSMEVLAVGKDFNDPRLNAELKRNMVRPGDVENSRGTDYDSVTLLVTPAQAAKLMVGQKMGSFRVALRGRDDEAEVQLAALKSGDFLPSTSKKQDEGIEFIIGGSGSNPESVRLPLGARPGTASDPVAAINPLSASALEQALMRMGAPGAAASKEMRAAGNTRSANDSAR